MRDAIVQEETAEIADFKDAELSIGKKVHDIEIQDITAARQILTKSGKSFSLEEIVDTMEKDKEQIRGSKEYSVAKKYYEDLEEEDRLNEIK